jgi:hypothetical protein
VINHFLTLKTKEPAYVHLGPESCVTIDAYIGDRNNGPLFLDRTGKSMTDVALTMLIGRTASRLHKMDQISAHSFRKTHRTLLESRIPESYVKKLQGKATDTYIRPEETGELTRAYIENYDVLRVFADKQVLESVKQELSKYKTETNFAQITQQSKITELESTVEELKALLMDVLNKPEALAETKRRLIQE